LDLGEWKKKFHLTFWDFLKFCELNFGKVDGEKGKELFYFCLLLIMKKGDGKGRGSVLKAPPFIW